MISTKSFLKHYFSADSCSGSKTPELLQRDKSEGREHRKQQGVRKATGLDLLAHYFTALRSESLLQAD